MAKRKRETFYLGIVDGKIHFYWDKDYYDGVRHADLFRSLGDAEKCYQEVVRITVERQPQRKGRG